MVGPPKTLLCLRKLEANPVVTCDRCGRAREFDREALAQELLRRGKSREWALLRNHFRCSGAGCRSRAVTISIVAFADGERREPFNEALATIRHATARSKVEPINTPAVRMALDVLRPYCADPWPIEAFWQAEGDNPIGRSQSARGSFNGMLRQLGLPPE